MTKRTYSIARTHGSTEVPPCDGCVREVCVETGANGAKYYTWIWTIELDDLVEFTNKINCPIILGLNWPDYGMPHIEIYDDYRE